MEFRTAGAATPPRGDSHSPRRADDSWFQELCVLVSEPALLPLNAALPQAESPVLKSHLATFMLGVRRYRGASEFPTQPPSHQVGASLGVESRRRRFSVRRPLGYFET